MNPLHRMAGRAVDRVIGLSPAAVPYVVRPDVGVPMTDGVVLLGDHYRPAGPDRPLPVVLIRSPYGRAGFTGLLFAAPLARRGFQVFIQSTRGTFGSGGQFRPFMSEREDGLATVGWLRDQPWCDGQVSMTGGSYLGHTQWAVAPYADLFVGSATLTARASPATSSTTSGGSARRPCPLRTRGPATTESWRWTWSSTRRPTGYGPGTGSGCGSAGRVPPVRPQPGHRRALRRGDQGGAVPVRDLSRLTAPRARPAAGPARALTPAARRPR
jgi:X-Pro dipeptidyl-peptidase (S15 family)